MTDTDSGAPARSGRPRVSSQEVLAEAACELFLEQGYTATTVAEITTRAGVSRSSFFNYFTSKSDILWGAFDEKLEAVVADLAADPGAPVAEVLGRFGQGFPPDSLALGVANAEAMGLAAELERERALRQMRLGRAVAGRLSRGGAAALPAEVTGAAYAGAVLAAVWRWAAAGPGHTDLDALLSEALGVVAGASSGVGSVRQLRVVARADHFEGALAFYRDVLGMPERDSYEGDGGARVAILDAGRATLELANAAQVALIDRVETDGDAPSESIRIAFEVDDTASVTARLAAAGAFVEATPRETPWRSVNSRLRAPAGLQITVFQERDDQ